MTRYTSYGQPTPRERYEREILPRWLAFYAGEPALGYWLRRAAWGQGYATELGRALVAHGFERVGAGKISARALVANAGSRRVMEKCGLAYECDFVFPEDVLAGRGAAERAAVKYSITRPQWLARQA